MSSPRYQYIPTSILAEEERRTTAEQWGKQQRTVFAQEWADQQRADADQWYTNWLQSLGSGFQDIVGEAQRRRAEVERTKGIMPAGEAVSEGLELAGRPQQAIYGAITNPEDRLEGARAAFMGETKAQPFVDVMKKGKVPLADTAVGEVAGFGVDVLADPLNVTPAAVGKLGKGIKAAVEYAPEAGRLAGNALRAVDQVVTSPGFRRLAPGLSVEAVEPGVITEYPKAGKTVAGLTVQNDIPNMSSIESSLNDYEILPGIRSIPMSAFPGELGKKSFYAADDYKRVDELAKQIEASGWIKPLIVVVDDEGPYILEGSHRVTALYEMGKKEFPALVVIDRELLPAGAKGMTEGGNIPLGMAADIGSGAAGAAGGYLTTPEGENPLQGAALGGAAGLLGQRAIRAGVKPGLSVEDVTRKVKASLGDMPRTPASEIANLPADLMAQGSRSAPETAGALTPDLGQTAGPAGTQTRNTGLGTLPSQSPPGDIIPPSIGLEASKKAGLREGWDRARNVVAAQSPAGQELAQRVRDMRDLAETTAGRWATEMPTVRQLSKIELDNFVDVAEGKARAISDKVTEAANEWGQVREEIYYAAQNAMMDVGRLENYFPHRYDPKMFADRDKWNEAVKHLITSGQAATREEAAELLRYVGQGPVRNRREGNLEMARVVDLPGFERTKEALFGYVEGAAQRIAQVRTLGEEDAIAMRLIDQIRQQGGDADAAKHLFDISVGAEKYGKNWEKISSAARTAQVFTKLGLGALTNLTQSVNTATVTGGMRTLLATPKAAFSPEAKEFALKAGVTLDGVLQDLREGGGWSGKLGKIGAPGFNEVEKFNRTLAAWAGKSYAEDMAKQAVKGKLEGFRALQKMGLDAQDIVRRGGSLNEDEQIKAARSIVERTQFKVDPQDLPGWASSPQGRMVMQFRTFSYNQTAFMWREVMEPAIKDKDVKPLIRFLVYGLPVGAGMTELQDFLRNRPSEEDPVQAVRQYYQRIGGIGVLGEVMSGLAPKNSKYLPGERYALQAAGVALGPTVSTALEGIGSIPSALQGKPENLARFALKQIPIVGPTIKNTALPYKPGGRAAGKPLTPLEEYRRNTPKRTISPRGR